MTKKQIFYVKCNIQSNPEQGTLNCSLEAVHQISSDEDEAFSETKMAFCGIRLVVFRTVNHYLCALSSAGWIYGLLFTKKVKDCPFDIHL